LFVGAQFGFFFSLALCPTLEKIYRRLIVRLDGQRLTRRLNESNLHFEEAATVGAALFWAPE
jgi:hypothetical protein